MKSDTVDDKGWWECVDRVMREILWIDSDIECSFDHQNVGGIQLILFHSALDKISTMAPCTSRIQAANLDYQGRVYVDFVDFMQIESTE